MRTLVVVLMLLASAGSAAPPSSTPSSTPASSSPTLSPKADSRPRVFVAPLGVGAGADAAVVALVEERLLVSARRHAAFDVVAARDVKSLFDVEATRQAAGCDGGIDCAAELAGALDAPQLVNGQLGRVGSTWILSLTRLERVELKVLARVNREARGDTPEGLLRDIDGAVDELFADTGLSGGDHVVVGTVGASALPVVGGVVAAGGVAGLGVGVAANVFAQRTFDEAKKDLEDPSTTNPDELRTAAQKSGDLQNTIALGAYVVGAVVLVVGVVLVVVGAVGGE